MSSASQSSGPGKTKETASHRQNNRVKELGTLPVPSNLCTPLIAVSTAVRSRVPKTVFERQLPRGKTQQQDNPFSYESPALDISWVSLICQPDIPGHEAPPPHHLLGRAQELCESRGGRPGLSVLTSLPVSVDVKLY